MDSQNNKVGLSNQQNVAQHDDNDDQQADQKTTGRESSDNDTSAQFSSDARYNNVSDSDAYQFQSHRQDTQQSSQMLQQHSGHHPAFNPYNFGNFRDTLPEVHFNVDANSVLSYAQSSDHQYSYHPHYHVGSQPRYSPQDEIASSHYLNTESRYTERNDYSPVEHNDSDVDKSKSNPKAVSPPHSSEPTTASTTTPTSIGQLGSPDRDSQNNDDNIDARCKDNNDDHPQRRQGTNEQLRESHSWPGGPKPMDHPLYMHAFPASSPHLPVMDNSMIGNSSSVRASIQRYNPANYPAAVKLLVSNNVAGSIIGRSGQTISELQMHSHTRIKLSQTGDFYPGTQDRVCLVQGQVENVKLALCLLIERLYMLQEHQYSQHVTWQIQKQQGEPAPPFDFVVRVLVPSTCCGMIIGKSGSNIKYMEESTGVSSVRLSPRDSMNAAVAYRQPGPVNSATTERAVTVTGQKLESCLQCVYLIFDGMVQHPEISRYTNMTTTYSRIVPDPNMPPVYQSTLPTALPPPSMMAAPVGSPPSVHPQMMAAPVGMTGSPHQFMAHALAQTQQPIPHQLHPHLISHSPQQFLHLQQPPQPPLPHQHSHTSLPSLHHFPSSHHSSSPDRSPFWGHSSVQD